MLNGFNNTQKGILSALCGFTAFAIADACAKWLGARYDTIYILFWVYFLSFVFGLCASPFLGGLRKTIQTKKLFIHICRGICALAIGLLVVTALSKGLPLATLYTILFTAPFLTTIAAIPIYKESVPLKNWFIIALGFSGILIAFHDGLSSMSSARIYAFCALMFIVILGLLARPVDHKESLLSLSFYPAITISGLLSFWLLPDLALPEMTDIPIFLLNGLCVTVGLTGIAYGFRIAPYSVIAPVHYSQMVVALVIGYFVFNDIPEIWVMTGASVIIISGIMLALNKNNRNQ